MKLSRVWCAVVVALGVVATVPATASAAPEAAAGVMATYDGKRIDLSKGWHGARACAEIAIGDVRCYATTAEANRATQPTGAVTTLGVYDCPSGWVCLWQYKNFEGRRLQWSQAGTKYLADWDFRDRTSAVFLNRIQNGMEATNYVNNWFDEHSFYCAGCAYSNLADSGWDNKIDKIKI
jgi:hypothetical protein